jgi:hypothetical protein
MGRRGFFCGVVLACLAGPTLALPFPEDIPLFTFEPLDTGPAFIQYALTGEDAAFENRFTVYWSGKGIPRSGLTEKQQCLYGIESVDCTPVHRPTLRRLKCITQSFCTVRFVGFERGISVCETREGFISAVHINDRLSRLKRIVIDPKKKTWEIHGSDPETGTTRLETFRSSWTRRTGDWFCDR